MGSRKRVKPNPSAEGSAASLPATVASQSSQYSSKSSQPRSSMTEDSTEVATPTTSKISKPNSNCSGDNLNQVHKTKSWYGSWPRIPKSAASTQVARESILGGTSKPKGTVDLSRFESKKASDGISINELPLSGSDPSKSHESMAAAADESSGPVAQTSEEVKKPEEIKRPEEVKKPEVKIDAKDANQEMAAASGEQEQGTGASPDQPTETPTENPILAESTPQRPASGWFGWLGKPAYTEPVVKQPTSVSEPTAPEPAASATAEMKSPDVNPGPDNKEVQPEQPEQQEQQISEGIQAPSDHPVQGKSEPVSGSYWFWRWSSTSLSAPSQPTPQPEPEPRPAPDPSAVDPGASACPMKEPEDVAMKDAPAAEVPHKPSAPPPRAGSTWAFWSRDTSSASGKKPVQQGEHGEQGEQGQLAVMGESSETHPKRANSMEFNGPSVKEPPLKSGSKDGLGKAAPESSSKRSKRVRPQSMDIDDVTPSRPSTPKVETSAKSQAPKTPATAKTLPPNLLLPSFSGTYKLKENASILKQIAQLLLRTQQPSAKHVYLTKEPPKIKKAIAIGVHGLFPANYLRPMIGQPTGTSIKFAKHCAEAVRRWADAHGCEDCVIEKVALEGEGKIGERVENLWKLLLNWIDHIRHADLILIACHSQGVPVSIMLLAKLIELGVVTSAKVGVCAMAGVSLGPFPDYRSSMGILMGSAAELWEFADPQSDVSKRLEASTKAVLSYGARITYVGSIDDQLVPLESAIYAPAHHPYIYRAVFIDGRIHAPDFIAHLVGFALKLRNLGVSDHGLIRELSAPLAGSLYSGEGHSRLYDDEQVYDLAVTHALETTDIIGSVECEMHKRQGPGLSNPNPYHLPWIMRGLLEEDFVKTELSAETAELVRQFDDWKPVTKALKDVKYRLEAVRSKL